MLDTVKPLYMYMYKWNYGSIYSWNAGDAYNETSANSVLVSDYILKFFFYNFKIFSRIGGSALPPILVNSHLPILNFKFL